MTIRKQSYRVPGIWLYELKTMVVAYTRLMQTQTKPSIEIGKWVGSPNLS